MQVGGTGVVPCTAFHLFFFQLGGVSGNYGYHTYSVMSDESYGHGPVTNWYGIPHPNITHPWGRGLSRVEIDVI